MKTQISRWSFDPSRRRSGIYQQQGRMITDADLNELMELLARRVDDAVGDVVGSGLPRTAAVGLVAGGPALRRGTLYVDGLRGRLEPDNTVAAGASTFGLNQQADFPWTAALPAGDQILYADVWDLATTALQDPTLLDPGLHGADTAMRTQTLVQVKWCAAAIDPMTSAANPPKGNATVQVETRAGSSAPDPCDPCAAEIALDERIGNYVFRLEVHDVRGDANAPTEITLKWSSENGAEQHAQASVPPEFKLGDWIYEFYSDTTERLPGAHLATPVPVTVRNNLSDGWPAASSPLLDPSKFPYVRRWDGCCTVLKSGPSVSTAAIAKDKGIALTLRAGSATPTHGNYDIGAELVAYLRGLTLRLALDGRKFLAGDYWLATVREDAAPESRVRQTGDYEETATPPVRRYLPLGITHHYLVLARVNGATVQPLSDAETRRLSFPPLANLTADRIGYSTGPAGGPTEKRWQDILDDLAPGALPLNVQQALDGLVNKLESSDIGYVVPTCATVNTLRSLLWPAATATPDKIKDLLDFLLCKLDTTSIPYQLGATTAPTNQTLRQWLDALRTDVNAKVNRAGDIMTGGLAIGGTANPGANNLQVAGNCVIGGNLTVQGDTTTINVAQLEVEDAIVRVNKYAPQATPQPVKGGLEVFRGGTAPNAQVIWDESAVPPRWKVGTEGALLPIATGEAQDVVTGFIDFLDLPPGQEMISGEIDPGLGVGPICIQFGLDDVNPAGAPTAGMTNVTDGSTFFRQVFCRFEVVRGTGRFRAYARRVAGVRATARVRWWALKPRTGEASASAVIAVTISPTTATIIANATQQFTASVSGTTNLAIVWSVLDTGGGTVNAAGLYTAPAAAGTFRVAAASAADTSKLQIATVTVQPKPKDTKETKEIKDTKEIVKEALLEKIPDTPITPIGPITPIAMAGAPVTGAGRSFIRPDERPDLALPAAA